jgi:putative hydrolase of the HAD superfamily
MIKALIFDIGNVLVAFDFKRAYARLAPVCRFSLDEARARLRSSDIIRRLETGQISGEQFIERFSTLLELNIGKREFHEIWSAIFLPEPIMPDDLLGALKQRYPMIVLSNTNALHFEVLRSSYTFLRHFHHEVLSHEVGALKPAPEMYREAVRAAGCLPGECFFTDDIPEFVEGAKREGIDAVRFESPHQVEEELRARGVAW